MTAYVVTLRSELTYCRARVAVEAESEQHARDLVQAKIDDENDDSICDENWEPSDVGLPKIEGVREV